MNFFKILIIVCCLSSCAPIARFVSTPTYSQHSDDIINFDNKAGINKIFIKKGLTKSSLQQRIVNDVELKLKNEGIEIVSDINDANYVLSLNVRNISYDLDYNFANNMRNALTSKEINCSYSFDNNNIPHVNNGKVISLADKNNRMVYRRLLPSALYSMLGGSVGFTLGFTLAGVNMPFLFGAVGAVALGGTTYIMYNTFRKTGIVVSYDISIDERKSQTLNHSRKTLTKKSSNSSDETYYSYNDNWDNMTAKNIIIAIGSRALKKDMIKNIHPMIVENILEIFNIDKRQNI